MSLGSKGFSLGLFTHAPPELSDPAITSTRGIMLFDSLRVIFKIYTNVTAIVWKAHRQELLVRLVGFNAIDESLDGGERTAVCGVSGLSAL